MSKDEIVNTIKTADYFDEAMRQKWLNLILSMNQIQFDQFSKIIIWAEEQKKHLKFEKTLIDGSFNQFFAALKSNGLKTAKKWTYANAEARSMNKDEKTAESLINSSDEK